MSILLGVLRADPSTHSARPWPRPWRSMKASQRLISASDMRQCQACVRNKQKRQHVQKARVSVVLVSSHLLRILRSTKTFRPFSLTTTIDFDRFCMQNIAEHLLYASEHFLFIRELVMQRLQRGPMNPHEVSKPCRIRFSGRVLAPCVLGGHGGH